MEYFTSHLNILLFPFSFHVLRGTPPPCPTPRSVLRVSNNDLFFYFNFVVKKCVLSIFIYNVALQNTDFGVLQRERGGGGRVL